MRNAQEELTPNNNYLNFKQDVVNPKSKIKSTGVGFAARDIKAKELEVQKEIRYELVKNDG
jgi:hypothetical protein